MSATNSVGTIETGRRVVGLAVGNGSGRAAERIEMVDMLQVRHNAPRGPASALMGGRDLDRFAKRVADTREAERE